MALFVAAFAFGALTVVALVAVMTYLASKHEAASASPGSGAQTRWSAHVGSLEDPAERDDRPAWEQHARAAAAGDPGIYKARRPSPFGGERWDPYAASQSTASRAKASRRKPRPQRTPAGHEPADHWPPLGDPYALLGVSRVASAEEIERAYRRRVSMIHPDKFHGDAVGRQDAHEKLKQLNLAMQALRARRAHVQQQAGDGSYSGTRDG